MIAEKKCRCCGRLHTVVIHRGKFWFDGDWRTSILNCPFCAKGDDEIFMTGDYGRY